MWLNFISINSGDPKFGQKKLATLEMTRPETFTRQGHFVVWPTWWLNRVICKRVTEVCALRFIMQEQ